MLDEGPGGEWHLRIGWGGRWDASTASSLCSFHRFSSLCWRRRSARLGYNAGISGYELDNIPQRRWRRKDASHQTPSPSRHPDNRRGARPHQRTSTTRMACDSQLSERDTKN